MWSKSQHKQLAFVLSHTCENISERSNYFLCAVLDVLNGENPFVVAYRDGSVDVRSDLRQQMIDVDDAVLKSLDTFQSVVKEKVL